MSLEDWSAPDDICHATHVWMASVHFLEKQFFHSNFPSLITDDHLHINCLEMLVVIVAVQIW